MYLWVVGCFLFEFSGERINDGYEFLEFGKWIVFINKYVIGWEFSNWRFRRF